VLKAIARDLKESIPEKFSSQTQLDSWPQIGQPAQTIAAGEFKAKCLKLLDQVAETRQPLVITKFGKPIAQLVPLNQPKYDIIGALRGSVLWEGDIISPIDVEWDAMK
jgi:prevent-host-death family protein